MRSDWSATLSAPRWGKGVAGVIVGLVWVLMTHPGLFRLSRHTHGGVLYDALGLLGGIALLWVGFGILRRKRLLENVPTSRVRSVAMGFAELLGVARNRTPLVAPYSGIPCVFYRYEIEVERRGRRGRRWEVSERGASPDPFYLTDETGSLLVDPADAEIVLERSFRTVEKAEGFFGGRKRYSEWWIVTGQKIFVAGTVWRVRDAVLEKRAVLGDRLRELKHDPERMKAFDTDQDGRISTEEWGNAVRAVQDDLLREEVAAPPQPAEEEVAIGKGIDEPTFVIAARGEGTVLLRLRLGSAGSLLGGALAVALCAVSLLSRAGLIQGAWVLPW